MIGALAAAISLACAGAPAKVYLFLGQSNMSGSGKAAGVPASAAPARVQLMQARENGTLGATKLLAVGNSGVLDGFLGPEVAAGKVLESRYTTDKIVFVKISWGGTSLQGASSEFVWRGGQLYTTFFLPNMRLALGRLADRNAYPDGYVISGIFWMQGENDAGTFGLSRPGLYSTALKTFVETDLRAFLKREAPSSVQGDIPFVYGMIRSHWPFASAIQEEQRRFQYKATKVRCVPEGKLASVYTTWTPEEFALGLNLNHYDATGQLALGTAMGRAMIEIATGSDRIGCPSLSSQDER